MIAKKPRVVMPSFILTMISAPIATLVFSLEVPYEIAGLGLNSLIAPLNILAAQGKDAFLIFVGTGVVLPAVITLFLYKVTYLVDWTKCGT